MGVEKTAGPPVPTTPEILLQGGGSSVVVREPVLAAAEPGTTVGSSMHTQLRSMPTPHIVGLMRAASEELVRPFPLQIRAKRRGHPTVAPPAGGHLQYPRSSSHRAPAKAIAPTVVIERAVPAKAMPAKAMLDRTLLVAAMTSHPRGCSSCGSAACSPSPPCWGGGVPCQRAARARRNDTSNAGWLSPRLLGSRRTWSRTWSSGSATRRSSARSPSRSSKREVQEDLSPEFETLRESSHTLRQEGLTPAGAGPAAAR